MDNNSKQRDSDSEADAPQDIKSRIAAFEQNSGPPSASAKPTSTASHAATATSRTAIPHGMYDPLQAMSGPSKTSEPAIIKVAERTRAPSASSSASIKPSPSASTSRVALPGLGAPTPSSSSIPSASSSYSGSTRPGSMSHSRPWPPVGEISPSSDVAVPAETDAKVSQVQGSSLDALDFSTPKPNPRAASPVIPASPAASLPPPQLPSRKNSNASTVSASTSFSIFSNVGSNVSEPSSKTSRVAPPLPGGKPATTAWGSALRNVPEGSPKSAPAPTLPPRRQESRSPSVSVTSPLDTLPRPPVRSSTLSTSASPLATPSQSRSGSISSYPAPTSNSSSRSSTLLSDNTTSPAGPSLDSLPPRPREQSKSSARSMPPPPNRANQGHTGPPPLTARPNGSQVAATADSLSKRYSALWDKLVEMLGQSMQPTASLGTTRLDGLVVRQIWKMSRLSDAILSRIWLQCDMNGQGSLDKAGFCKGLQLIDTELSQKRGRRGRA